MNKPMEENRHVETTQENEEKVLLKVVKRNGSIEEVNRKKLADCIAKNSIGLPDVDHNLLLEKVQNGLHDQISTAVLYDLLINASAMNISNDPAYSKLAARLLNRKIIEDVNRIGIKEFSDAIEYGMKCDLIHEDTAKFVADNKDILNQSIQDLDHFEYFGLKTVYDRYLLKDPVTRIPFETPQFFLLRVACGLAESPEDAINFYNLISSFEYMPSTPTLFNSGTKHPQMSSCYLLDSPVDDLQSIYQKYTDVALLSKYAGGIGLAYHRVRSTGSLIKGTNGKSNGIVPFLKTLDSSVMAVNQGGKRKGAACVYLESWHADIEDFLRLRDNTGDEALRTHNLNLANWIPDLFMKRVMANKKWSLFDPAKVPQLTDLYGDQFTAAYLQAEKEGLYEKQVQARDLYGAMIRTLAQTGNGWMTFKDACNEKANQTGYSRDNVIHLSNLCTEIVEVTSDKETAVCNLGSINISRYYKDGDVDYDKLATNVRTAVKFLDRVVDINFYPIQSAKSSNHRWRPVGLGLMGLQDLFFKMDTPFDSDKAKEVSAKVQETIYYNALCTSLKLAIEQGPHDSFEQTKAAKGMLQPHLWGIDLKQYGEKKWSDLAEQIKQHGLRNSLLIAIAPTATIASICGSYECIEPQVSNLFKRETLSGEFLQINTYLVKKLKKMGLWNKRIKDQIKLADGSIQHIPEIPEDVKLTYRTVWEIPQKSLIDMAADRGPFIDQSQSLNLFMENPNIGRLSAMYKYAWEKGLKTTYYLRSRSATKIQKTTVKTTQAAVTCSLENPETCESCT